MLPLILIGCGGSSEGLPTKSVDAGTDTVMVVVAGRDLYPGLPIVEKDLFSVEIAPVYLPDGVFLSPEHVVGRVPRYRVLANEFVRAELLADPEDASNGSELVPKGMRAVTLPAGLALEGNTFVDLHWTPPGSKTACALAQAVFVVAPDAADPSANVAVQLTPQQALDVVVARRDASFRVVGRNDLDTKVDPEIACSSR